MARAKKAETVTVDARSIIVDYLTKTGREGMDDFIPFLDEIGFFTAPCSGGHHLCKQGGLAEHSLNVLYAAEKLSIALYGSKNLTDEIRNNVVIAALLHDLGKCGDFGKPMYVENILKSTGKVSEAKPFKTNKDLCAIPHAVRSLKLATLYLDLTEDEEWAILSHGGLYDTFLRYDIPGNETPLSLIIHWADMWASHVIEDDAKEEREV